MRKTKIDYRKLIVVDILFSLVHILNIIIQGDSQDLSLIPVAICDLLICLIYMIVHGIVTYYVYRCVLYPHFITGAIMLASTVLLFLSPYGDKRWIIGSSVFLCVFLLLSFVISLCGKLVYALRRHKQQPSDGSVKPE